MKRVFFLLAITLLCPLHSIAQGMFKCIHENKQTWQDVACTANSSDLKSLPAEAPTRHAKDESTEAVQRPDPKDSTRTEIQLGTLDLHVLNNRRWGKPQRITRSREARAWHERWAYQAGPNAGMQLHFVNGRLAGVEGIEPPASTLGATMIEEFAADRQ